MDHPSSRHSILRDGMLLNGKVLYVTDIKSFVESIVQALQGCLLHDLFFNITDLVNVERWSPGVVNEEPRNTRAGYSCFTDPRNSFVGDSDLLLRTVLDHPKVSGRFHFVDQNGQLVWKAAPCFEYLEHLKCVFSLVPRCPLESPLVGPNLHPTASEISPQGVSATF